MLITFWNWYFLSTLLSFVLYCFVIDMQIWRTTGSPITHLVMTRCLMIRLVINMYPLLCWGFKSTKVTFIISISSCFAVDLRSCSFRSIFNHLMFISYSFRSYFKICQFIFIFNQFIQLIPVLIVNTNRETLLFICCMLMLAYVPLLENLEKIWRS